MRSPKNGIKRTMNGSQTMVMFDAMDYRKGNVLFVSGSLSEDMLQVEYPNNYLLDVGWYGKENGFCIYLIKDMNWEAPVAIYHVKQIVHLKSQLQEAIQRVAMASSDS